MVQSTPIKPLPLLILHLDQGEKYYAGKTIDFRGIPFVARVISFGTVERTLPYPTGLIAIPDAVVEVADTDGQIRAWFDERTPIKRIGELSFEFEYNSSDSNGNIISPLPDPENQDLQSEYIYRPFFTGEVSLVPNSPPGKLIIQLRDITASWLSRTIPNLGIRDNFSNMPDDVESIFVPIIFGRCYSKSGTGLEPQGVIDCKLIDTTLHRYVIARHQCYGVPQVYRKKPHDARFFPVDNLSEYSISVEAKVINGINYNFTYIDFAVQQPDGTEIHADVSGINYRWDFPTDAIVNGVEVRDFVDSIVSLTFLLLQDEVNIQRFDADSFAETRSRAQSRGYLCDGAITEQVTNGLALSRLCGDAVIDFYQTNRGIITLHLYDAALDADSIVPLDDDFILKKSLEPGLPPPDKLFNRIRYRYYRQNAGLSEFRKNSNTGQWGEEYLVDYLPDQEELAATGTNPSLETQVELYFVRDDNTAKKVIKDRLSYYNLRSYIVNFDLSGPLAVDYVTLSQPVALTEIWGIGPAHSSPSAGWVDKVCKVYGITFDLNSLECRLSAVVPVTIDDGDLYWSINYTFPVHDAQVRKPHLTTTINGSVDPSDPTRIYPAADQTLDIQDSLTEVVTAGISFPSVDPIITNFSRGPSASTRAPIETTPGLETAWSGILWEEDVTTTPRSVKGYVPMPFFGRTTRNYVGTLSPDERPTDLTDDDAGQVTFYAVDFDRYFLWIGSSTFHGLSSSTGWIGVNYDMGMIAMFMLAPSVPGWHLCNGATVNATTIEGGIASVTLENLVSGSDRFPRFTSTYVPISDSTCNAVAPSYTSPTGSGSVAGTIGLGGNHNHTGTTGSESAHTHTIDHGHVYSLAHETAIGGPIISLGETTPHTHSGASGTGTTGAAGGHDHTGSTSSDGAHDHGGATGSVGDHTHSIQTESSFDPNITVTSTFTSTSVTNTIASISVLNSFIGNNVSYSDVPSHDHTGSTGSSGSHDHTISSGGGHTHTITAESNHTHSISLSGISVPAGTDHTHEVPIPSHVGTFSHAGNSGVGTSHSHSISDSGTHSHSFSGSISVSISGGSVGSNGRPKSVGVMPYFRL